MGTSLKMVLPLCVCANKSSNYTKRRSHEGGITGRSGIYRYCTSALRRILNISD